MYGSISEAQSDEEFTLVGISLLKRHGAKLEVSQVNDPPRGWPLPTSTKRAQRR